MKNIACKIMLVLWCVFPLGAYAQDAHWSCDERAFQYDMTAYISLVDGSGAAMDLSVYEVAAFVGTECRGTARLMTLPEGGASYGYLRIRSNVASGEVITFKAYNKDSAEEIDLKSEPVTFVSNSTKGLPSSPFLLVIPMPYIPGDTNGDGDVTVFDITRIVNYILTGDDTNFNFSAADMNGDGEVTVFDITQVVSIILKNE